MTDEPALLAAVAAAPDDDTPRLVYADWLDDHGRPERAEFVRVQCRLAAASPADDDYPDLLDRQDELAEVLEQIEPPRGEVPTGPLTINPPPYRAYRRGFPAGASVLQPLRYLPSRDAERHLRALPNREVEFSQSDPHDVAEHLAHPLVAELRGLTVRLHNRTTQGAAGHPDDGEVVAAGIAASPHLRNLCRLAVRLRLTPAAVAALARADLPGLTDLHLELSPGDPGAVAALAGAAWLPNLHALRLGTGLGDDHLVALAALPTLPRLHTLDLNPNCFGPTGAAALAGSAAFPALARLELAHNPLGDAGAAALARGRWSLRVLGLTGCGVGGDGLGALLAGSAAGVRDLRLRDNLRPGVAARELASSPGFEEVRRLEVDGAARPDWLAALAASPRLARLTNLDLSVSRWRTSSDGGEIAGLTAFLAGVTTPNLRRLDLGGLAVGKGGARSLAGQETFNNLRVLGLGGCRVGNAGLVALGASRHLRGLVILNLGDNQLTAGGPLHDPAAFPQLAVCRLHRNRFSTLEERRLTARRGVTFTERYY